MSEKHVVETRQTDLATFLGSLASELHRDALALVGFAHRQAVEDQGIQAIIDSLERKAALIEAGKDRLCQGCKMLDVAEHVTFGEHSEDKKSSEGEI